VAGELIGSDAFRRSLERFRHHVVILMQQASRRSIWKGRCRQYLNYDPLQLTCTVRVEPLNKSEDGRGSKRRDPVKNMSLFSLHYVGHHFSFVSFTRSLEPNLCLSLSTHNAAENHCIISYAQKWQPNVFLTGTYRVTGHKQCTFNFPQRKKGLLKVNWKLHGQ